MKLSSSPWGAVQQQSDIAPGIISVSTAGHGGFWVSPERWARIMALFPEFRPYCGQTQWLEEDCEWALAALAFHAEFQPQDIYHAIQTARGDWYRGARIEIPADALAIAEGFRATIADKWEVGCMGGGAGGSWFHVRHVTTGESRSYRGEAPWAGFLTDADLGQRERIAA